jgi:glycosyltransferase involved in cell wall biosynthesis
MELRSNGSDVAQIRREAGVMPGDISVVIPFYNNADKLQSTLTAVANQTLQPREIIIVDDGSSDEAKDALGKLKETFGFTLISQPNRGPAAARNTAMESANCSYVALLDADDIWHPGKLERQHALMSEPGGDARALVVCNSRTVDEDGRLIYENRFAQYSGEKKQFAVAVLNNRIHSITSTLFFRREAASRFNFMNEHLRYREDHAFIVHLLGQGDVGFVDEFDSSRVIHRASYSHSEASGYILNQEQWDSAFFADVAQHFTASEMKIARAIAAEHNARNDVILGRHARAMRTMVQSMARSGRLARPALIIAAAMIGTIAPAAFDKWDRALAARRKATAGS